MLDPLTAYEASPWQARSASSDAVALGLSACSMPVRRDTCNCKSGVLDVRWQASKQGAKRLHAPSPTAAPKLTKHTLEQAKMKRSWTH